MDYKDYYRILGVKKAADDKEIKRAYRKLALQYHPDKNPGNKQAEEKFKEINEAYEVLGNPDNRQKYDQLGSSYHHYRQMGGNVSDFDFSQWFNGGGTRHTGGFQSSVNLNDLFGNGRAGGFSEFFQQIFGSDFGSSAASSVRQNKDMEKTIDITLDEAYHGATRDISVDGSRLTVKIPPGSREGTKIRLRGKGHQGSNGRGDLFLVVQLQAHPDFTVEESNLWTTVDVDVVTAVLGGKTAVPTLTGPVQLSVPSGIQPGQTIRLKGKGLPLLNHPERFGDLLTKINVRVPTRLTAEQRHLYEQLSLLDK